MFWYFDDTLQARGGFVLGAFVVTPHNPEDEVARCLCEAGLTPGNDEFKSGAHMGRDPRQAKARECLHGILSGCRANVALVVVPSTNRSELGIEALHALRVFLHANGLASEEHHVRFDQGSFLSKDEAQRCTHHLDLTIDLQADCDSRIVLGIQLADLAAHSAGIMLLAQLGVFKKMVKAGENSGYDPDMDMELEFELWAGLRHALIGRANADVPEKEDFDPFSTGKEIEPYGLYISPLCPEELAQAARTCFGFMYLGCVH